MLVVRHNLKVANLRLSSEVVYNSLQDTLNYINAYNFSAIR